MESVSQWAGFVHYTENSPAFDYNSIMLYVSEEGAQAGKRTLTSTETEQPSGQEKSLWKGGNPNPKLQSISDLDIERIKQLYPSVGAGLAPGGTASNPQPRSDTQASNGSTGSSTGSRWQPLRVEIPGILTTTVKPAPTYDASDEAAAKATNANAPEYIVDTVDYPPLNETGGLS